MLCAVLSLSFLTWWIKPKGMDDSESFDQERLGGEKVPPLHPLVQLQCTLFSGSRPWHLLAIARGEGKLPV